MGVADGLTYQRIQELIAQKEIPRRILSHPEEVVRAVYRYGAPVACLLERCVQVPRLMPLARGKIAEYEAAGRSLPSGLVLLADELTGSRGRFDRLWHAPPGGIWLTLVLANTLLPESARLCPLAAGAACCETIRSYGIDAHLKWVNDVHVLGRKICGVLTESFISPEFGEEYLLVGVGINVNNRNFPPELHKSAVSMADILPGPIDLEGFVIRLLARFSWYLGLLFYDEEQRLALTDGSEQSAGPGLLLAAWQEMSDTIGRRVWFGFDVEKNPQYQAEVLGLAADGGLVLRQLESDRELVEYSGELRYLDRI